MAQANIPTKASGDSLSHTEFNTLVTATNSKADGARKAYDKTAITTNHAITHNFGTTLGLAANQYALEVRAYDANGELVGGITVAKTSADIGTLTIAAGASPFTGTIILDVTPF